MPRDRPPGVSRFWSFAARVCDDPPASPALSVLLDFNDAKGCDAKRELLDRVRQQGDARMLAVLQKYQPTRGCGFLGVADCYPCLHRDQALRDATSAIEERSTK